MKAIILDPGAEPVVKTVPDSQQLLDSLCGGFTTLLRFPLDAAGLLYLESGQTRGLEQNRQFRGQWYYGRMMVVGTTGAALCSLTPEQQARYLDKFRGAVVPWERVTWPEFHKRGGAR